MKKFLKVQDRPGLVRDVQSNGIINTDEAAYKAYQKKKQLAALANEQERAKEERLNNLEGKVNTLENKLDKILELLTNGNT